MGEADQLWEKGFEGLYQRSWGRLDAGEASGGSPSR